MFFMKASVNYCNLPGNSECRVDCPSQIIQSIVSWSDLNCFIYTTVAERPQSPVTFLTDVRRALAARYTQQALALNLKPQKVILLVCMGINLLI